MARGFAFMLLFLGVPSGRHENSPAFQGWVSTAIVVESAVGTTEPFLQSSLRDSSLLRLDLVPGLKAWATLRPSLRDAQPTTLGGGGVGPGRLRSITDTTLHWPSWDELRRALLLRDYNTRVVVIGATLLGAAAGVIGTFAYLRKRAMLGDALSHATLPGIAAAFMLTSEKNLTVLMVGATITGVLGVGAVMAMRTVPRIKEDAAIGIVLSVFFGAGMVLFSIIQKMQSGEAAGLQGFIYGKAAAMVFRDATLIAVTAGFVMIAALLLFKEFRLVCFDKAYASAQGWPVLAIDVAMMALVVLVTVVGLQAVGLILIVALLIIPAAGARFWTDGLGRMVVLAGVFGTVSGYLGSTISALTPRMPTGAVIVLVTGILFLVSMFFSPHRGLLATFLRRVDLARRVSYQHFLRATAELEEHRGEGSTFTLDDLRSRRSWSAARLASLLRRARRGGLVRESLGGFVLTPEGRTQAQRVLKNHRLWELYLINYADVAPSHVDRDADELEHVLPATLVRELERALARGRRIPPSPHPEVVT